MAVEAMKTGYTMQKESLPTMDKKWPETEENHDRVVTLKRMLKRGDGQYQML